MTKMAEKAFVTGKYLDEDQEKYGRINLYPVMMPKNLFKIKYAGVLDKSSKVDKRKHRRRNIYSGMMSRNQLKMEKNFVPGKRSRGRARKTWKKKYISRHDAKKLA